MAKNNKNTDIFFVVSVIFLIGLFIIGLGMSGLLDMPVGDYRGRATIDVYTASSMYKIGKNEEIASHWGKNSVVLDSAKNEHESFQIILRPKKSDKLNLVDVRVSHLSDSFGNKIDRKNIKVSAVGYVDVDKKGSESYSPDILFDLPYELNRFSKRKNYILWVNVKVPKGTKAGLYTGQIDAIISDNIIRRRSYRTTVNVRVHDVTLPKQTYVWTQMFSVSRPAINKWYFNNDGSEDELDEYVEKIFRKIFIPNRISPGHPTPDPKIDLDKYSKSDLKKWFNLWASNGLYLGNIADSKYDKENLNYDFWKVIQSVTKGFENKFYVRLPYDEAVVGDKMYKNIRFASALKGVSKSFLTHQTFGNRFHKIDEIRVYNGFVDIWAGVAGYMYKENYKNNANISIKGLTKNGPSGNGGISWYVHRNVKTTQSVLDLRSFFWEMMKYDVRILNHWRINNWENIDGRKLTRVSDGFVLAPNKFSTIGDLIWPGKNGPLSSIRLETMRDGIEDYELWNMLGKKIRKMKRLSKLNLREVKILSRAEEVYNTLLLSKTVFHIGGYITTDITEENFIKYRQSIFETIEDINDVIASKK